ncbi:MAG: hypothetical protein ACRD0D_02325 [Acidimicrobiales bacterium]
MSATVELSPLFDPTLDRVGFPLDHPYPAGAARPTPAVGGGESPVAARLRAFGTNGPDPLIVAR